MNEIGETVTVVFSVKQALELASLCHAVASQFPVIADCEELIVMAGVNQATLEAIKRERAALAQGRDDYFPEFIDA